jgi:hypothetical protein
MTAPAHHARDALEVRAMLEALGDALDHRGYLANLAACSPEGRDASLFIGHAYLAGVHYGFEVGRDARLRMAANGNGPTAHARARATRRKNPTRKGDRR